MFASLSCRLRDSLGVLPRSDRQILEHLRHLKVSEQPADKRLVRVPWGWFEYSKLPNLVSQFESIFIGRGYSFTTSAATPVIIDCGGNMGVSALWFRQSYPGCALTVYEADPNLAGIIRRNLDRAGHTDVDVRNNAVWSENVEMLFAARGDDMGRMDPAGNLKVKAIDLSAELPGHVDLLKMDIEGAEFQVFERLIETQAIRRVQNIIAELHPSKPTKLRMLGIMQSLTAEGFDFAFSSDLATWTGVENEAAAFPAVGNRRMYLQFYAWRT